MSNLPMKLSQAIIILKLTNISFAVKSSRETLTPGNCPHQQKQSQDLKFHVLAGQLDVTLQEEAVLPPITNCE